MAVRYHQYVIVDTCYRILHGPSASRSWLLNRLVSGVMSTVIMCVRRTFVHTVTFDTSCEVTRRDAREAMRHLWRLRRELEKVLPRRKM